MNSAVSELDADGAAGTDVDHRREAVHVIRGPLAGAAAPTELAAAGRVDDARLTMPRRTKVIFHVGVVGEHLAVRVEREVELVAIAGREDLPRLAVRVGLANPSTRREHTGRVTARIPIARQQDILVPVRRQSAGDSFRQSRSQLFSALAPHRLRWSIRLHLERQLRVIACNDVERLAVGRQTDCVWPVFAAARDRLQ